jgi:undecaprenyl-diphosphatase
MLASLAAAVWFLVAFLETEDFRTVAARIVTARPWALGVGVGFVVLHLFLWAFRWKLAIRRVDPTPRRRIIYPALAAAASVNLVAPFAKVLGGLLRARYVARDGQKTVGAFLGVVLFDQWAHFLVMSALTLGAIIAGLTAGHRYWLAVVLGGGAVVLGGVLHLWAMRQARDAQALARRFADSRWASWGPFRPLRQHGSETLETFSRLLADVRLRWQATALGLLVFLAAAGAQAAAFWALGSPAPFLVVCVTVALSSAVATLAATPGGVGVTEASMIGLFVWLGVDRVTAAAAALLYRAVYYLVVLATGLPSAFALEWFVVRERRRSRAGGVGVDRRSAR